MKNLMTLFLAVSIFLPPLKSRESLCFLNDEQHRIYACGEGESFEVALTFDDGPHPVYTPLILDILKEAGVKATFFVIGENVRQYPDLVKRMIAEGHTVGNHTYSHGRVSTQEEGCFKEDVAQNSALLRALCVKERFFRPPGGECDQKVWRMAEEMDYDIILWTVDTEDWKAPSSEQIVSSVLQRVKGGDIVLFHDYVAGKSNTPDALSKLLKTLPKEGYTFVTVEKLIEKKTVQDH